MDPRRGRTAARPHARACCFFRLLRGPRIEVDTSLPAARVIRALNELVEVRGAPLSIRLDKGPEFIANALALWAQSKGIALQHIQPGKPTQNADVERFNKTYPPKCSTSACSTTCRKFVT